jgi:hypothetical protein
MIAQNTAKVYHSAEKSATQPDSNFHLIFCLCFANVYDLFIKVNH